MPELPEVETHRRVLLKVAKKRKVAEILAPDPAVIRAFASTSPRDVLPDGLERLSTAIGKKTVGIDRHGKRLGWRFEGTDTAWLMHLGMTGDWTVGEGEPGPAIRIVVKLDDGTSLWFDDPRRFGCIVPTSMERLAEDLRDGHGPDALDEPLDGEALAARLRGKRAVKVALMDQAVIAGIGNIHAVEILWRAQVHPSIPCGDLKAPQLERIAAAIPDQMKSQIGDAPIQYINRGGENRFVVYGKDGQACPRCNSIIERTEEGGRGTYFCPDCQKKPTPKRSARKASD
jgi:formamidopyrimidine-DNA glycosylase